MHSELCFVKQEIEVSFHSSVCDYPVPRTICQRGSSVLFWELLTVMWVLIWVLYSIPLVDVSLSDSAVLVYFYDSASWMIIPPA